MDDHEKWELECKRIRALNKNLLKEFADSLKEAGVAKKTIDNHYNNIDFYINEFLLYEDAVEAHEGIHSISMFLGYWFIKKAMWASASSIRGNAASLKKFYGFLLGKGMIEQANYEELKQTIKEEMPEWLSTLKRYDDPRIEDMEEVWGI